MEKETKDAPYTNREIRDKWHEIGNTLHDIKLTQEKATREFAAHQDDDHEQHLKVDAKLQELINIVKPIAEVYGTVAALGRWSKIGLATLLLMLSVAIAIKNLWWK